MLSVNPPLFRANLSPLTFFGVSPDTFAQAMLGIYEMGRVELLRDLPEPMSAARGSARPFGKRLPSLIRLTLIKDTVRVVVFQSNADAQTVLDAALPADLTPADCKALRT